MGLGMGVVFVDLGSGDIEIAVDPSVILAALAVTHAAVAVLTPNL